MFFMPVHIRPYSKTDSGELLTILDLNTPQYFAIEERRDFEIYLEKEIDDYFVITIDETIVGSGGINYDHKNGIAKISWDIISPLYHGQGIGTKLLHYRIDHLKTKYPKLSIVVRTSQVAYRFYEKNSFELVEIQKDYWAKGFDLYYMSYKSE